MRKSVVAASTFCVLVGSTAWAQQAAPPGELETLKGMVQEVISENRDLRRRVRELEAAMTKREQAAKEAAKESEPAKEVAKEPAKEAAKEPAKATIELGGAIEVGVGWRRNFARVPGSDLNLETAEVDFEAKLLDWGRGVLAIEWDRDLDKLTVNEALVTLGGSERIPFYLTTGRGVVPFGISSGSTVAAKLEDTLTLTDPLTIEVFDAKEDYVLLGVKTHGFTAGAYVFNGTTNRRGPTGEKRVEHFGAAVGYGMKNDTLSFAAGINMIDSVFDSDGLTEKFPEAQTFRKYAPGLGAHVRFGFRGFSLVAAYNAALREVEFRREETEVRARIQPSAWHIEGGYTTEIFGDKTYGALSYSHTHELAGAFSKTRKIATVARWLAEDIRVTFDYAYDEDYTRADGGTGRYSNAFTLRLTYEW
jgi:hypothetical protein